MTDERYDAESLSSSEWRRIAAKREEEIAALRRDNDRLGRRLADITNTVTEMRRDLYWHVEQLTKTLHP